jgi:Zn-dependent peptidase ImmA (M78 family)
VPSVHTHRGAKRAREAREALGLGRDGPLRDILHTIETDGGAHVLVLDLPDDVAGAYLSRPGIPLLVVCATDFIARQRFTLAHEFGHFRMGHEAGVDKTASINGADYSPREVMANTFAAEFLAPKAAIKAWGAGRPRRVKVSLEDVVGLASEYGVSAKMMRIRLSTAGVLADEAVELCQPEDSLSRAAAHLPRVPEDLCRSQLGDLLCGRTDLAGFSARLGCSPAQAQAMLATMGADQRLARGR